MQPPLHPISPPPGYPRELEQEVTLTDGTIVFVRPVVPEDAAILGDEILTADAETLYSRFFTTGVQADQATLDLLTTLDYTTTLALGCIDMATGEPVAISRYAATDDETVEIAVAVKPEWRRRGLAMALLDLIEGAAAAHGYVRLSALHLAENVAAAKLLDRRGYELVGAARGVVERIRRI